MARGGKSDREPVSPRQAVLVWLAAALAGWALVLGAAWLIGALT